MHDRPAEQLTVQQDQQAQVVKLTIRVVEQEQDFQLEATVKQKPLQPSERHKDKANFLCTCEAGNLKLAADGCKQAMQRGIHDAHLRLHVSHDLAWW